MSKEDPLSFVRTLWASTNSGKVYMVVAADVDIPELKQIPDKKIFDGIVLADMHTGKLVVFSYGVFYHRFKKITEYKFKTEAGIDQIIKGKV